jgi:alpha-N-arabinofuranosidase
MVNVLQAVILTEGEKMLLTPTYHVFHMYKCHQDAELVQSSIETETIGLEEQYMVPNLNESASIGKDGKLHITISNLSITDAYPIEALRYCTPLLTVRSASPTAFPTSGIKLEAANLTVRV